MVTQVQPKHDFTYDGVSVRVYHANKGEGIPMHTHVYSHATMCVNGACKYTCDGKVLFGDKNTQPINLLGGTNHEIEALEDGTVFVNVFAEGKY